MLIKTRAEPCDGVQFSRSPSWTRPSQPQFYGLFLKSYPNKGELDEAEMTGGKLVVPGHNATVLLPWPQTALHGIALPL